MTSKEKRFQSLENSRSYQLVRQLKTWLDDYYLDGFIGLVPIVGDFLTQIFNFIFVYVSAVKIRSLRLTIAIIFNSLLDILIGIIPYLGSFLDFFNKSYKQNFELIEGFVSGNSQIINKVNKRFVGGIIGLIILIVAIYFISRFAFWILSETYHFILNLV